MKQNIEKLLTKKWKEISRREVEIICNLIHSVREVFCNEGDYDIVQETFRNRDSFKIKLLKVHQHTYTSALPRNSIPILGEIP